jgi:HAD superfamily hydrolase (TIGR01549 family)
MIKAILFDLDDTLLGNDIDTFMASLFAGLGNSMADLLPADEFQRALWNGSRAMIANVDPSLTNGAVFCQSFATETGLSEAIIRQRLERYYHQDFVALKAHTEFEPVARPLLEYCFAQGYKIAIATNPLYPATAIEQRLAWAGVPVSDFDYAMVTHMDNTHATKPNRAYYREICATVGVEPWETMMVGDSWENDIDPADKLHMTTFWVAPDSAPNPAPLKATSRGTLAKLYECCQSGWLSSL